MALYQFDGCKPRVTHVAFVAESALVISDVQIGKDAYIGHGAILRGDYSMILVGEGIAIEEGVLVLEGMPFVFSSMVHQLNN